ncbi:MAG: hypothetical protein ACXVW3_08035, partial [Nocardioidaceae bacterium]
RYDGRGVRRGALRSEVDAPRGAAAGSCRALRAAAGDRAEGDPAIRVWWLVLLAPVFALLFAGWERWVVRPACR